MPNSHLTEKLEGKKWNTYEKKNLYILLITYWNLVTWTLIDFKKIMVLPKQLYYSCSLKIHLVALEPPTSSRYSAFTQSTIFKPVIIEKEPSNLASWTQTRLLLHKRKMVTLIVNRELDIVKKRGPLCDAPSLNKKVNYRSNSTSVRKILSNQNVYITKSHRKTSK